MEKKIKLVNLIRSGLRDLKEETRHENIRNENGLIDYNKFMELIKSKENEMNNEFVRKQFSVQNLENLL